MALQNRKSTLKAKEGGVVNLITSQIKGCRFCQSSHTALGKMNGFADEQIIELRQGPVSFDSKIDALVKFTESVVENKGQVTQASKDAFFAAGYNEATMIDVIMVLGDKTIGNYIHNLAGFEIDFPDAEALKVEAE